MSDHQATVPINEMFRAFQGEGVHLGRPAYFIRTHGCPVQCPWCDSAGTWNPGHIPEGIKRMRADEILDEVTRHQNADFLVLTGGEPTIHAGIRSIVPELASFRPVHLETSGAFPIPDVFEWVTVSPKDGIDQTNLDLALGKADEIKLIIEKPEDIERWLNRIARHVDASTIWLHPEWSHREDPHVLNAISRAVQSEGRLDLRAGWQIHKLYGVDQLDPGSRPNVPLGGDESRGY